MEKFETESPARQALGTGSVSKKSNDRILFLTVTPWTYTGMVTRPSRLHEHQPGQGLSTFLVCVLGMRDKEVRMERRHGLGDDPRGDDLTGDAVQDCRHALDLLKEGKTGVSLADKAYDSGQIVEAMAATGAGVVLSLPPRRQSPRSGLRKLLLPDRRTIAAG